MNGYESSGREASEMPPPPRGPAPGARKRSLVVETAFAAEVDTTVDAALGDLVQCAYHDRWLRARLQIVEDHINDLRCENAQLRGDLGAAYCRMDDMEGYNDD